MRIGLLSPAGIEELDRLKRLGLRSMEWVRFAEGPAGPDRADWKPFAEEIQGLARERDIRISAISAYYRNPLDPKQTENAERIIRRAIEVASHLQVKTVAAFSGAEIELETDPRGGYPVYQPLENGLPRLLTFWEPLAEFAADKGVRIAFENCPQRADFLPVQTYNFMSSPTRWERLFDATRWENLGLEWDPSHLVCQLIDPVDTIRRFGSRIFHVHAKDAVIHRDALARFGIAHPGVSEHRFPGLGQCDWAEIVRELLNAGYDSDLNIEGMHDPVYRNHDPNEAGPLAGMDLEDDGVLIAKRALEQFVPEE